MPVPKDLHPSQNHKITINKFQAEDWTLTNSCLIKLIRCTINFQLNISKVWKYLMDMCHHLTVGVDFTDWR